MIKPHVQNEYSLIKKVVEKCLKFSKISKKTKKSIFSKFWSQNRKKSIPSCSGQKTASNEIKKITIIFFFENLKLGS